MKLKEHVLSVHRHNLLDIEYLLKPRKINTNLKRTMQTILKELNAITSNAWYHYCFCCFVNVVATIVLRVQSSQSAKSSYKLKNEIKQKYYKWNKKIVTFLLLFLVRFEQVLINCTHASQQNDVQKFVEFVPSIVAKSFWKNITSNWYQQMSFYSALFVAYKGWTR